MGLAGMGGARGYSLARRDPRARSGNRVGKGPGLEAARPVYCAPGAPAPAGLGRRAPAAVFLPNRRLRASAMVDL